MVPGSVQVRGMLSAVGAAAPQGAELEAFLGKPCNHMARLIRDLSAPESVQENLKNVLAFIKNVSPFPALSCLAASPLCHNLCNLSQCGCYDTAHSSLNTWITVRHP